MKSTLLAMSCAAVAATCAFAAGPASVPKHYVLFGFEFRRNADARKFLDNADLFRDAGIDGVGVYLPRKKRPDGTLSWSAMNDVLEWRYEDYAADIPLYREGFRKAGLTHNFLKEFFCAPKRRIDWNDDAAWARVARTLRLTARIAREMGCRGMCVDHEDYHRSSQFSRRPGEPPFDELAKTVRRRGREVFAAAFDEFPEAELFFFWFLGGDDRLVTNADPEAVVRDKGELWPAFANGILDALPPTAKIVDADEWGYYHPEKEYFDRLVTLRKVQCLGLVAPENRARYRAQVSMGFGLYTDMYINPVTGRDGKPTPFYRPPTDGSRLKTFAPLLAAATDASDEYVWFWNEKVQWVKWNPPPSEKGVVTDVTLEDCLPGLRALCDVTRGASGFVARRERELEAKGLLKELARPVASNDCCSVKLEEVKTGEFYVFRAEARGDAKATVYPFIGGKKLAWWDEMGKIYSVPFGAPDAAGWRHAEALVRIPDGVDSLEFRIVSMPEPGGPLDARGVSIKRLLWFEPDAAPFGRRASSGYFVSAPK